ncbi:juvenile hormone esterase-like isoform X1 [Planococcus citri]|uniref:juvenile hormone esterase-like isoform X1 n=1 Tax=Planococcus citri TaxID=170843 RepID=UPI0031F757BD
MIMFGHKSFNFIIFVLFVNLTNGILLTTKQGILKGEVSKSRSGRTFYTFYGIPYAEPPVGKLRFQNPILAQPWEGIRDATVLPPSCIYHYFEAGVIGQEDCLYLNVYTPKITNETLLPVMVLTFGGRFMYGDALPHRYGPHYLMDRDVILITFHYRLGILGFLSTEDETLPGNYGLKDGVAVLQWVQKYIADFGGDKDRVTIFGGSSGGMTTSLTLLSPLAKGLFHRVISQSGDPFSFDLCYQGRLAAWKLGSMVDCTGDDVKTSDDLVKCLKSIPAEELASHNNDFFTHGIMIPSMPWSPIIESENVPGAFLVDDPTKLIQRNSDIPWMMGMNSDEGGMMALFQYFRPDCTALLDELNENYKELFPLIFGYGCHVKDPERLDFITETYKKHYFGENNISQDAYGFSKMFSSLKYLWFTKKSMALYQGPKYFYYYDHKNEESFAKTMIPNASVEFGVIHGDELISLFNWSSEITPVTKGVDLIVSEQMLDLWTNFAANGDPNYKDKRIWDPVESSNLNYLHIQGGTLQMKNEFMKEESEFLENILGES